MTPACPSPLPLSPLPLHGAGRGRNMAFCIFLIRQEGPFQV